MAIWRRWPTSQEKRPSQRELTLPTFGLRLPVSGMNENTFLLFKSLSVALCDSSCLELGSTGEECLLPDVLKPGHTHTETRQGSCPALPTSAQLPSHKHVITRLRLPSRDDYSFSWHEPRGLQVRCLLPHPDFPAPCHYIVPKHPADHAAWLRQSLA